MWPFDWPLRLEQARGGQPCRICGEAIEANTPQLTNMGTHDVHIECARLFSPYSLPVKALLGARLFTERDRAQVELRKEAMEAQGKNRAILRGRSNAAPLDPTRFDAVEPVCDRRGAPVVRLYVDSTTAFSRGGYVPWSATAFTARSARRTYVMLSVDEAPPQVEDVAIPTAGALVIVDTSKKLSLARARALDALKTQGIRAVFLWIISADDALTAKAEQQVRGSLNNAGFNGDEAPSMHARVADARTFATLLEALDAALVAPSPPVLLAPPAQLAERHRDDALATLDAMLVDNDVSGVKKILQIAAHNSRVTAAEPQQFVARRALDALANDELRPAVLALAALALRSEDAAPLARWYEASAAKSRSFTREHESATRTLVALGVTDVVAPIVAQFARCSAAPLLKRMADVLGRSKSAAIDTAAIALLAPMIESWDAADSRAKVARELVGQLRARVRRSKSAR
jgi:hypothetical protein